MSSFFFLGAGSSTGNSFIGADSTTGVGVVFKTGIEAPNFTASSIYKSLASESESLAISFSTSIPEDLFSCLESRKAVRAYDPC